MLRKIASTAVSAATSAASSATAARAAQAVGAAAAAGIAHHAATRHTGEGGRPFELWRQDTHGNSERVALYATQALAEAALDKLTDAPHKQHFWVSGETTTPTEADADFGRTEDPLWRETDDGPGKK